MERDPLAEFLLFEVLHFLIFFPTRHHVGLSPRPYDLPQVNIYSTTDAAGLVGRYESQATELRSTPGPLHTSCAQKGRRRP